MKSDTYKNMCGPKSESDIRSKPIIDSPSNTSAIEMAHSDRSTISFKFWETLSSTIFGELKTNDNYLANRLAISIWLSEHIFPKI